MTFNSYEFIFLFLPAVVAANAVLSRFGAGAQNVLIVVASAVFYGLVCGRFLGFLCCDVLLNFLALYLLSRTNRHRRLVFAVAVALNVAKLGLLKYADFVIASLNGALGLDMGLASFAVPLGISFFTFQQIAYLIETFDGDRNCGLRKEYFLYVFYFPKLLMGPLSAPGAFMTQLFDRRTPGWSALATGSKLFVLGLAKKLLLADTFARAVNLGFSGTLPLGSLDVVLMAFAYAFELYFDFSGYCDMALGVSRMLGIGLPSNFDSPYRAVSVKDFWRRWHMTLTDFLARYVYFPLGGSRCGSSRTYLNIMAVFLVSGIWHGANWTFIVWGLCHGLLVVRDRLCERVDVRLPTVVRRAGVLTLVTILWLLFRSESVGQFAGLVAILMRFDGGISDELAQSFVVPELSLLGFTGPAAMCLAFGVACAICFCCESTTRKLPGRSWRSALGLALLFAWSVLCLGTESRFLYFNF